MDTFDVAIIGGGAAGVLVAAHLLRSARAPFRIALFEKAAKLGEGIAYSTQREEHVLNESAARMSAFDDDPSHFVRHLVKELPGTRSERIQHEFVERRRYATYLRSTLAEEAARSEATLSPIHEEVVALEPNSHINVITRFAGATRARTVVLALGNWPRSLPFPAPTSAADEPILHAWDTRGIASIASDNTVAIVGAGLSMVDTLLTLAANAHNGAIHVVSRHGLFPLPHERHGTAPLNVDVLARLPLSRRVALLRSTADDLLAQGEPWQWTMDRVRPHVTMLWHSLDDVSHRRFLRHGVRLWDVHRHRIAPAVAGVVDSLRMSGLLVAHTGSATRIMRAAGRTQVTIRARAHNSRTTTLLADRVVSSIGMETSLRKVRDALVQSMFGRGLVRPGRHGIGFDTTMEGAVVAADGTPSTSIFTLGSVRVGQLWESIAIPELRVQAAELATKLCSGARAAGERI